MRKIALLLPLLLAACAAPEADPPSLGPREIEGVLDKPARAIAPVASADDPALAGRIAGLVAEAEEGDADFRAQLPETRNAVAAAAGAPAESEGWILAQVALSALDGMRSPTATAMGALDEIFAMQAIEGSPVETGTLLAARDRVAALYSGQSEAYEALAAQLRNR